MVGIVFNQTTLSPHEPAVRTQQLINIPKKEDYESGYDD